MTRRFVGVSAVAVALAAAFLPGSGLGSSAAATRGRPNAIPAGLADAIQARLGMRTIRSGAAAHGLTDPSLGLSVAVSEDGTTALVGAPGVAGGKGAAYIFHATDAGSWSSTGVPTATLTNKRGKGAGLFGFAVALSADGMTAVVGAPLNGTGLPPGAISVFHASAEDSWKSSSAPAATLTVSHSIFLGIGLALSPDGTTLVAGAPLSNALSGGAYVFHAASEGAWASTTKPVATLSNAAESSDDGAVGVAVAISGDDTTVLLSDDGNPNGGGAYVYNVASADAWASSTAPTAILSDSNSDPTDSLGSSLALSNDGTLALLGATGDNSHTGSVDVFHSSGEAAWSTTSSPTARLLPPAGGHAGDTFGGRVAVSTDGTTALVTAPGVNSTRGAAYVFRAVDESSWVSSSLPSATLNVSGGHKKDDLGIGALTPDGATALIGAPGVQSSTGAAYAFHVTDESSWASSSSPNATLTVKALAACVVPKVKGMKLAAAKQALAVGRCRLGKVGKVRSTKKHRGRVLSQSTKAGKRLAINAKIAVKVGK